ncbi:hypothetical protein GJ496_001374 [Pomphorhynchus laevis]|nr:hypothetical protein GJ496_001374 [Pomphorhynchus laevis]
MLDFLTIFTKGGLVLWYFDSTINFRPLINQFINERILQSKVTGGSRYRIDSVNLQFSMDNEFNLLFVVAYQNIVQLSYVDKLLDEIQLRFRDKYKNELKSGMYDGKFEFSKDFDEIYSRLKSINQQQTVINKQKVPRKWNETAKAKKTVASLLKKNEVNNAPPKEDLVKCDQNIKHNLNILPPRNGFKAKSQKPFNKSNSQPLNVSMKRSSKKATKWEESVDIKTLDYSQMDNNINTENDDVKQNASSNSRDILNRELVGKCIGDLKDIDSESYSDSDNVEESYQQTYNYSSGFLSSITGLLSGKALTADILKPVILKMHEHLLSRNVASEVSECLCNAVEQNLIGQTVSTFQSLHKCVRSSMTDMVLKILTPDRHVNVLRDALAAQENGRTFVIVFCGVNGVGKSTSLAKIAFWLIENNLTVMIAACDTFRSGAVEQLQTHVKHLNSLHPPERHNGKEMVTIFQKGYGGDAASVCFAAINKAKSSKKDVVLIDTAGRMQDNEPLMRALTKLIHLNQPDLVLFVGEALVGNEAVDQVRKFNESLMDLTSANQTPRLIDGIVLTKFDTVDDKVGAAVSMCYTTGKPVVFVGTGQTYSDLKNLNANAVVNALMK